jgi:hypothetical protein
LRLRAIKPQQAKPLGNLALSNKFWTAHKPKPCNKQLSYFQPTGKRSLISQPALDLSALIETLQQANQEKTLSDQLAIIEFGLVSVELNPNPKLFVHTIQALKQLASISSRNRNWHTTTADLAKFFEPKQPNFLG